MNLLQLIKMARLGVDAILPGGNVSSQWSDEEMVVLANSANDEIVRRFRLKRKKWGLLTIKATDAAFNREGETYTPATELTLTGTKLTVSLPPDCAEVVRILCLNNRSIRFSPAEMESQHWIDDEQDARDITGASLLLSSPDYMMIFFDIVGERTLVFTPPVNTTLTLQLDYVPFKRPLYYTGQGTVSQAGTALTGVGTLFTSDNIFTEDTGNRAELITLNDPFSTIGEITDTIRMDRDYPRIASFQSDTAATMVQSATVASTPYVIAMAPAIPRDVHRWLGEYMSALMLKKINPELSQKYSLDVVARFDDSITLQAGRRQSQESPVTEDAVEFGAGGW